MALFYASGDTILKSLFPKEITMGRNWFLGWFLRICAQDNDDVALAAGLALQCEIWDYDMLSRFLKTSTI